MGVVDLISNVNGIVSSQKKRVSKKWDKKCKCPYIFGLIYLEKICLNETLLLNLPWGCLNKKSYILFKKSMTDIEKILGGDVINWMKSEFTKVTVLCLWKVLKRILYGFLSSWSSFVMIIEHRFNSKAIVLSSWSRFFANLVYSSSKISGLAGLWKIWNSLVLPIRRNPKFKSSRFVTEIAEGFVEGW